LWKPFDSNGYLLLPFAVLQLAICAHRFPVIPFPRKVVAATTFDLCTGPGDVDSLAMRRVERGKGSLSPLPCVKISQCRGAVNSRHAMYNKIGRDLLISLVASHCNMAMWRVLPA
jgi:hypothetical protein